MFSITYGEVSFDKMYTLIKSYLALDTKGEYRISIGTDSQNFSYTKIPIILGIHRVENTIGRGGIFFAEIKKVKRISNVRQKILFETNLSLQLATKIQERFVADNICYEISIHVDAGYNGPTRDYIPEIMGWVKACGFPCVVKPDSYMASSVANRLSK